MSERDIAEGRKVITSVGTIVYRNPRGDLEILVGKRRNEPWAGCDMIVFGGLVEGYDHCLECAARRELREETSGGMTFGELSFLGAYGPRSFHHALELDASGKIKATSTGEDISEKYKFVALIYFAEFVDGKAEDNREIVNIRFEKAIELARNKTKLAFDQALMLQDFCRRIKTVLQN